MMATETAPRHREVADNIVCKFSGKIGPHLSKVKDYYLSIQQHSEVLDLLYSFVQGTPSFRGIRFTLFLRSIDIM